ncbi:outer membrane beta-barrel protein [Natronospira bacteriovora]|uniref:Outer membrane protein beta-barrel domain-containing protein n=1 Tax=Natronospira bacteriovora TaxID=3069753 RepID=A0ABU0W6N7_9GAMM|nr:outer membrane beta-barrel protein [Natronospira sp. AB-CW4]MDQ2069695.1 hypothetical protein [Natronospira sp. AB-CW4]
MSFRPPARLLGLLLVACPAMAWSQPWEPYSWHLALEAGETQLDISKDNYRIDDSDTSLHLMAGYEITRNINIVGGYMDLGRFATDLLVEDEDGDMVVDDRRRTSVSAWTAHVEMHWSLLGFLHPNVGLGAARWRLDMPDGQYDDTQDTAPMLRLGLGIDVAPNSRLDVTVQEISRLNARTAALGLRITF